MLSIKLSIYGMGCGTCVHKIKTSLTSLKGVEQASVNLRTEDAEVVFDPKKANISSIIRRIESTGYGASELNPQN
ncbi:MAG: heavy-metal-associated domain-containing protein [Candidatus Hodarchaeales archaeon]|jgi:Cu+-exporting ATPase